MTFLGVSSEAWFPVITLIAGAILKGIFDLLAEKRAERRELRIRRQERQDVLRLKRGEFQHSTLLEFQEVLSRLVRFIGRAHHVDEMHFRETGKWKGALLPEDVDQGIATEQALFARLRVRIRDDETRKMASALSDIMIAALFSRDKDEARAKMMAITDQLIELTERVGGLLRKLEIDEDEMVADLDG
jgi:hypothetical protein